MAKGKYRRKKERAKKKAENAEVPPVVELVRPKGLGGKNQEHSGNTATKIGTNEQPSRNLRLIIWDRIRQPFSDISTNHLLTVFNGCLAAVAILQWNVTDRQLDVMRKSERAWISVSEVEAPVLIAGQPMSVHLVIRNIGKSPATQIEALANPEFVANGSQPSFVSDPPADGTASMTTGLLIPDDTLDWPFSRVRVDTIHNLNFSRSITQEEIDSWNAGKSWIAVSGVVSFRDSFNVKHWVRFCKATIGPPNPFGYSARSCIGYNKTDNN